MIHYLTVVLLVLSFNTEIIFDFTYDSDIQSWRIVDDVVMGGRSSGEFSISEDGHGLFYGDVSLENNGGFSSVRYPLASMTVHPENTIRIRLKGDGKAYQFRIKNDQRYEYSYIFEFETTGDWQEITVPVGEMYPVFRGRRLNRSDFSHNSIEEIAFLIGNGQPQTFRLLIDSIEIVSD